MICIAIRLARFFMRATLAFNDLRLFWQSGAAACIKFETFQGIIGFQENQTHYVLATVFCFTKNVVAIMTFIICITRNLLAIFFRYVLYHKYGYFVVYFVLQEICLPYCQLYFVSAKILKILTSFDIFFFKIFCSYLFMIL